MDRFPVTNQEFARFVDATGYVTLAERPPRAEDYPGADPALLVPGSLVFQRTRGPGRPRRLEALVAMDAGRLLAQAEGGRHLDP